MSESSSNVNNNANIERAVNDLPALIPTARTTDMANMPVLNSETKAILDALHDNANMIVHPEDYFNWMTVILPYLEFQGLNLDKIRKYVVYVAKSSFPEPTKPITLICYLGIFRGNNIDSIKKNAPGAMSSYIGVLQKTFKIVAKAQKNTNAITLARVALAFPDLSCQLAIKFRYAGIDPSVSDEYPYAMRIAAFGAFLLAEPAENITASRLTAIRKAYAWYQTRVSFILKKISDHIIKKSDLAMQEVYINNGMRGSVAR